MFARVLASKLALGVASAVAGAALLGGVAFASIANVAPLATNDPITAQIPGAALSKEGAGGRLEQILEDLVKKGVITADQKDKILAAIRESAQHEKGHGHHVLAGLLEDAAKIIGVSTGDLKKELPGKSLAQVAQAHGVSRDTLVAKLTADAIAKVDDAAKNGKLTAEQAAKLKTEIPQLVAKFVDRVWPTPKPHHGEKGFAIGHDLFADAAKTIGLTTEQLKTELPGKSVAQVAQAHGVARDALIQSLTTTETAKIDKLQADGKLSADQAARLKSGLANLITRFVDRVTHAR